MLHTCSSDLSTITDEAGIQTQVELSRGACHQPAAELELSPLKDEEFYRPVCGLTRSTAGLRQALA